MASQSTVILYVGTYTQRLPHVNGQGHGIHSFTLDTATGQLGPFADPVAVGPNPSYITATPHTLYAVNETDDVPQATATTTAVAGTTGHVVALAIHPDGRLQELNRHETGGAHPCHLSISGHGDILVVSNYSGGSLTVFPIDRRGDGALGPATDTRAFSGGSRVVHGRQEAAHVHSTTWIRVHGPGGQETETLVAADLGSDCVTQFVLATDRRTLVPAPVVVARPPGSGPRHFAWHSTHKLLYVINELANTIGVHPVDPTTGTVAAAAIQEISTLPIPATDTKDPSPTGPILAADLHLSSCGQYLLASTRGYDAITCYAIAPDGGSLRQLHVHRCAGKCPRAFLVHRDLVIVGYQDSNLLEVFRLDPMTGDLVSLHQTPCPTPVSFCIPRP